MSDNIEYPKNPNNGRAIAGIILLFVGAALLIRQFNYFFLPGWVFSWPMLLIAWGFYCGAKHNFRNSSCIVIILVGIAWLLNDNFHDAGRIVWPSAIILIGFWMILRRNHNWDKNDWDRNNWGKKWDRWENKWESKWDQGRYRNGNPFDPVAPADPAAPDDNAASQASGTTSSAGSPSSSIPTGDDYIDTVSIFGGVHKTILSKKFRGGDIVNIFGGTELDFTRADINGRVVIDITQIFGGTKIFIPSNWHVVSDIAAVFAGVDDKRMKGSLDDNKILVLKGVSLFAGIDIRSY